MPTPAPPATVPRDRDDAFIHLETLRGLAALLVLIGHLRAFVWEDYPQVEDPGPLTQLFYLLTGLGMPAVLIFFALSGFLISRSVDAALRDRRWHPWGYASARLARLWTVLLPALVLTAVWDQLGQHLSDGAYYRSELNADYHSGPRPEDWRGADDLATFAQNALFLQTITAPTFGSNIPLWSLAQEFWYYVLFPLAYLVIGRLPGSGAGARLLGAIALLAALYWLPGILLWGGLIWLCGVASAHWLARQTAGPSARSVRPSLILGTSLLLASVLLEELRIIGDHPGDLLIGLGCVFLLPALARAQPADWRTRWPRYARLARSLSGVSYTLYLTHFPLLGFLASAALDNRRFTFASAEGWAWFIGLGALSLAYAYLMHALFERHTPKVRRWLRALPARLR